MKNSVFSNYKVFTGNSHPELAEEIASIMGKPLGKATVNKFSDGEISVNLWETVRGTDCYIVQSTCDPVNDNLMELLRSFEAVCRPWISDRRRRPDLWGSTAGRPCGMSSCHRLLRSSFRHWEMNLLR